MEIRKISSAGTTESSDIMITVAPCVNGIDIDLDSSVEKQYGSRIRQVISETLKYLDISAVKITAVDKGALDCTIEARTITAVHRATDDSSYNWKEIDSWSV